MMQRRTLVAATTAAVAAALTGCSSSAPAAGRVPGGFVLAGIRNVTKIAQLTGPGAMNDTSGVLLAGADLGSMFLDGDRTWLLFGDNFGKRPSDAIGGVGEIWKSNCAAWTTTTDPERGLRIDGWITDDLGQVKEIVPGRHQPDGIGEVTKIPTQGFAVEEDLYLGYMSVRHWGSPGVWTTNHAGVAKSTDRGQSWTILDGLQWGATSGFTQLAHAFVEDSGRSYLYLWGIPAGRFGDIRLMRVPATRAAVENPGQYQYFVGAAADVARWSSREDDAEPVLRGAFGEHSVLWSPYLRRWLLTTFEDSNAVLYEGLSPWGPWQGPHLITDQARTPGLYAPYPCPRFTEGSRIYFTLSHWGPYQVFWYGMDLVLV